MAILAKMAILAESITDFGELRGPFGQNGQNGQNGHFGPFSRQTPVLGVKKGQNGHFGPKWPFWAIWPYLLQGKSGILAPFGHFDPISKGFRRGIWPHLANMTKMAQNGPKWPKMGQKGSFWANNPHVPIGCCEGIGPLGPRGQKGPFWPFWALLASLGQYLQRK